MRGKEGRGREGCWLCVQLGVWEEKGRVCGVTIQTALSDTEVRRQRHRYNRKKAHTQEDTHAKKRTVPAITTATAVTRE